MIESFGSFIKKKAESKERMPRGVPPEDVYDDHVDQIMHHLREAHKLTHPDSNIHKAIHKLGEKSDHVHELHGHLEKLMSKFGGR